jgi:hypothetical protein
MSASSTGADNRTSEARLMDFRAWPDAHSALLGHCDVAFPSGVIIKRIPLFRKRDGSISVGVPDVPLIDAEGHARLVDGKQCWLGQLLDAVISKDRAMPKRPDPDRTDSLGFTTREVGESVDRTAERIRQICCEVDGFAVRAPDKTWCIPVLHAWILLGLHLELDGHRVGAAELNRRLEGGLKSLRTFGRLWTDNPEFRGRIERAIEGRIAQAWWQWCVGETDEVPRVEALIADVKAVVKDQYRPQEPTEDAEPVRERRA